MPALQFILTTAGKAAIVNATNTGTAPIVIDRVAVGSASWTPTAAATALQTEIKKITAIGGGAVAPDTIHVTATDSTGDSYVVKEIGLYTSTNVLLAIYSQSAAIITKGTATVALIATDLVITGVPAGSVTVGDTTFDYPQATESTKGVAEIATTAEAQAGTDDERIITPKKLQDVTATELRKGVVELASDAETITGTDTNRAITPANLAARTATDTRRGIVELATNTEVQAGTDTDRAVTPAGLNACTATEARTGVIALASNAEVQVGTDAVKAVTPAALSARTATDTRTGVVELATATEVQTGTDTTRAVTPAGLAARTATETRTGVVELATDAETITGTDAARAVTPNSLSARTATDTRTGVVELATDAETITGTDAVRAVTPNSLSARTATTTRTGVIELATFSEAQAQTDLERAVTPACLGSLKNQVRAWCSFNGQGTVSLEAAYNVASISDLGVGKYRVNFVTSIANLTYAAFGSAETDTVSGDGDFDCIVTFSPITTGASITFWVNDPTSNTKRDAPGVFIQILSDLS